MIAKNPEEKSMSQTEAFARTLIEAQLKDQNWNISDGISVRYEYTLADGDRADYLLCSREGRGLAIVEAKRESINAADGAEQGRHNAEHGQRAVIDSRIVGRDYQIECIDTLCREIGLGRRKLLVEMATGTGKTRTAAASSSACSRPTPSPACCSWWTASRWPSKPKMPSPSTCRLPGLCAARGRRFQDEKRITITTLQAW
jgi:type I restriction enzyme R subunit